MSDGLARGSESKLGTGISELHRWYESAARELPWRRIRDPYAIWVSEVMLQQTQVATVIPYYERWMARFPDVASLAAADEAEVLLHWEGLGYYRRARNFHRAAQEVLRLHGGAVPNDAEAFGALPGVGAYTTAAVLSIAFDADLAVLDGNVKRVLARLVALEEAPSVPRVHRELELLAQRLLPAGEGKASLHNQAMMELGARICTPRRPDCEACPFASSCRALAGGAVESYPRRAPKKAVPLAHLAVAVVVDGDGLLLLSQRPYGGLLAGLWDLPSVELARPAEGALWEADEALVVDALRAHLNDAFGLAVAVDPEPLPVVRHAYSHLRVVLHPRRCVPEGAAAAAQRAGDSATATWADAVAREALALPRAAHKVLASWSTR